MSLIPSRAPSYWEKKTFLRHRNLTIVGSGIVGLSTAINVKRDYPDWKILVVDRSSIPHGASTKNAGFACFGSPSELLADIAQNGWEEMVALVKRRWEGLAMLKQMVPLKKLDYQACGGFEVFNQAQSELFDECADTIPELNRALEFIGENVFHLKTNLEDHGLDAFQGIIACPYEASIHPGQMMQTLISICHNEGIEFLNGVEIKDITELPDRVLISSGNLEVTSDLVVLATNAFTAKLLPNIDLYPARNQVVVTTPIKGLRLKGIYHHDTGYVYFRTVEGNRILLGGARNHFSLQERTDEIATTENVVEHLHGLLTKMIVPLQADVKIDYQWSGILGLGSSKTPLTHWHSDRIFVACRMGGMGISIGAQIGQTAAIEIGSR